MASSFAILQTKEFEQFLRVNLHLFYLSAAEPEQQSSQKAILMLKKQMQVP